MRTTLGTNVSKSSSPAQTEAVARARDLLENGATGVVLLDSSRGSGAGRRSFLAANPYQTLTETPSGFLVNNRHVDPLEWLVETARTAPFLAGVLGFELAWLLDRVHTPHRAVMPRVWAAAYDDVLEFPEDDRPAMPVELRGTDFEAPNHAEYEDAVRSCIESIYAGELFEINFTGRFKGRWPHRPFDLYEAMRSGATGQYFAFFDLGDQHIVSVSPEQFLTIRDQKIVTRPIKGTRRRGTTADEDQRMMSELAQSPKDRAENIMIVDLMRNDLTRVCEKGTVVASRICDVETFAGLHHLVSTVEGRLAADLSPMEALLACFPAGSITGAPKLRSLEIIAERETEARGFYTGSAFYVRGDELDSSVMIRTAVLRDGTATYGAGGAVVADSLPAEERAEAHLKASVFSRWFQ